MLDLAYDRFTAAGGRRLLLKDHYRCIRTLSITAIVASTMGASVFALRAMAGRAFTCTHAKEMRINDGGILPRSTPFWTLSPKR
jgi:hypothetical protein